MAGRSLRPGCRCLPNSLRGCTSPSNQPRSQPAGRFSWSTLPAPAVAAPDGGTTSSSSASGAATLAASSPHSATCGLSLPRSVSRAVRICWIRDRDCHFRHRDSVSRFSERAPLFLRASLQVLSPWCRVSFGWRARFTFHDRSELTRQRPGDGQSPSGPRGGRLLGRGPTAEGQHRALGPSC